MKRLFLIGCFALLLPFPSQAQESLQKPYQDYYKQMLLQGDVPDLKQLFRLYDPDRRFLIFSGTFFAASPIISKFRITASAVFWSFRKLSKVYPSRYSDI